MIHRTGTLISQRQGSWSYTPSYTTDGRQDTVEIFCTHGRRKLYVTEGINFHALEKEMATHFSVLAWRIPEMGSLVGCRLWGCTELDTTDVTQQQKQHQKTPWLPRGTVGTGSTQLFWVSNCCKGYCLQLMTEYTGAILV